MGGGFRVCLEATAPIRRFDEERVAAWSLQVVLPAARRIGGCHTSAASDSRSSTQTTATRPLIRAANRRRASL